MHTGSQAANAVEKGEKPPGDAKGKDGGSGSSLQLKDALENDDVPEISTQEGRTGGFFNFLQGVLSAF